MRKKETPKTVDTMAEQLALWMEGTSVHSRLDDGSELCCPDLSCCYAELSPEHIRIEYGTADNRRRGEMLDLWVEAVRSPGPVVYIRNS